MFQKWLFVAEVTFLKHILNPDEQNIYMLMNRNEYWTNSNAIYYIFNPRLTKSLHANEQKRTLSIVKCHLLYWLSNVYGINDTRDFFAPDFVLISRAATD